MNDKSLKEYLNLLHKHTPELMKLLGDSGFIQEPLTDRACQDCDTVIKIKLLDAIQYMLALTLAGTEHEEILEELDMRLDIHSDSVEIAEGIKAVSLKWVQVEPDGEVANDDDGRDAHSIH